MSSLVSFPSVPLLTSRWWTFSSSVFHLRSWIYRSSSHTLMVIKFIFFISQKSPIAIGFAVLASAAICSDGSFYSSSGPPGVGPPGVGPPLIGLSGYIASNFGLGTSVLSFSFTSSSWSWLLAASSSLSSDGFISLTSGSSGSSGASFTGDSSEVGEFTEFSYASSFSSLLFSSY